MRLTAIVLGAAAGGGFPQWNCGCRACGLARAGDPRVKPRTQAGLAVSADGSCWTLINASPDLRAQIAATPELHPRVGLRDSPIEAVLLTGAEVDQIAGLLTLRERQALRLYATADALDVIAVNPIFNVLAPDVVSRTAIAPGRRFALPGGLDAEIFRVPGKAPLYLEGADPKLTDETDMNVGLEISVGERRLVFVPGAASLTPGLFERFSRADVLLFDGTLFTDHEMIASGTGSKTGRRMGHMPISGEGGSLAALARVGGRRVYIHINNTNPILVADSPERRQIEMAGWEIAEDGMRIDL